MKKLGIVMLVILGITLNSHAQDDNMGDKFGLGFHLGQYQKDFGIGLNLTSPYFANDRIAIRLKGNMMWFEHLDNNSETTWTPYSNLSLGIVGVAGEILNFIRLYGEGGIIVLLPSSDFSSESTQFGGYGVFGFEFFFDSHNNYFIEIGGVGTGATADKIPGKPIYSNGLIIDVGYRYQF